VYKLAVNVFSCNIVLEHTHNHPVNSLEALSFKIIPDHVKKEIVSLFSTGLTPSQPYKEFTWKIMDESLGLTMNVKMIYLFTFKEQIDRSVLEEEISIRST